MTHDYAVGGVPVTSSVSDDKGTQGNAGLNPNRTRLLDQTAAGTAETRYCYDAAGRLLATEGAAALSEFTYDANGNATGWKGADGTTTLTWTAPTATSASSRPVRTRR
ncbi:hypothetical protein ACGFMK_13780 [Amycolatopsis sp. NPDC049252]|uniref:hypothetical protein n=1 Tax=Amycolatopsis sp. NPDC049252 TaxID=3363933 RepID=UPI00371C6244